MIKKIGGEIVSLLIATHTKQRKTLLTRRLVESFSDTYKLYIDQKTATIEKSDTSDCSDSTYSMIADLFEEEWVFDLNNVDDLKLFSQYMDKYFHVSIKPDMTIEEINAIVSKSDNITVKIPPKACSF